MIIDEQQGVHFGFFSASTQYLLKYLQINKQNVGENAIRSFELMNREQDCAECTTWLWYLSKLPIDSVHLHPDNSIFLSHQTSTSQPAVLFSHNKSAPATSHSQPNTAYFSCWPRHLTLLKIILKSFHANYWTCHCRNSRKLALTCTIWIDWALTNKHSHYIFGESKCQMNNRKVFGAK